MSTSEQATVSRHTQFSQVGIYLLFLWPGLTPFLPAGRWTVAFFLTKAVASSFPALAFSSRSPVWKVTLFRVSCFSILTLGSITPRFCRFLNLCFANMGVPFNRRRLPSISSLSNTYDTSQISEHELGNCLRRPQAHNWRWLINP